MSASSPQLIAILGAESTGKTTLAQALANHFSCPWVAEYLREFCDQHQRTPRQDEQQTIMDIQVTRENLAMNQALIQHAPFVFCDTAPLLTAIYSEYVFSDLSLYPKAGALHQRYAATLLLLPNIAWVADGLQREGAHVQNDVHVLIESALSDIGAATIMIQGIGDERTAHAVAAILNVA